MDIIKELYRTVELLGGDMHVLACIGSFRDTMNDPDTLQDLQVWNLGKAVALKRMLNDT